MVTTVDELVAGGATSKVFVGTNILVYSTNRSAPLYFKASRLLKNSACKAVLSR